ncbi:MAG TPA: DUF3175 domain-containing protein [Terriglobia bacterium]|nr:DUF3175 domain-containing protein [Terriglobia bacterium]
MPAAKKKASPATKSNGTRSTKKKYWSGEVTRDSDALDLERSVFTWKDSKRIARSLAQSARQSKRRKGTPLQSAMSMLNFYINRGGTNLGSEQKKSLEKAKDELRAIFAKK